jgi:hypothetical protein
MALIASVGRRNAALQLDDSRLKKVVQWFGERSNARRIESCTDLMREDYKTIVTPVSPRFPCVFMNETLQT